MKDQKVEFNIQIATESDAIEIWNLKRLLHKEGEFLRLSLMEKEKSIKDEIKQIQLCEFEKTLILIAKSSNNIIGYLIAFTDSNQCKISKVSLGVLQECREKGIGTALIREMENWARQFRFKEIEMKVMTHNLTAIRLYKKLGYEIICTSATYQLYESDKFVKDYTITKTL